MRKDCRREGSWLFGGGEGPGGLRDFKERAETTTFAYWAGGQADEVDRGGVVVVDIASGQAVEVRGLGWALGGPRSIEVGGGEAEDAGGSGL